MENNNPTAHQRDFSICVYAELSSCYPVVSYGPTWNKAGNQFSSLVVRNRNGTGMDIYKWSEEVILQYQSTNWVVLPCEGWAEGSVNISVWKTVLAWVFSKAEPNLSAWNRQFIWEVIPGNSSRGQAKVNERRRGPCKGALMNWPPLWETSGPSFWCPMKSSIVYPWIQRYTAGPVLPLWG